MLARAEVGSAYQPARKLWVRARNGHYLPNPNMQLRVAGAWAPVYVVMALDWVDRGCGESEQYRPRPLELVARLGAPLDDDLLADSDSAPGPEVSAD